MLKIFAGKVWLSGILLMTIIVCSHLRLGLAVAAPAAELWPRWQQHVESSTQVVDHGLWSTLLGKYLVTDDVSAVHRFSYGTVTGEDRQFLKDYLGQIQQVKVSQLNRTEQKALWVNVYNALTVDLILAHYPVKSIMDIDISPGFFSNGPWDAKLLTLEAESLSLNDIEHRILRPIFKDNRLHYALNCASLGCPNLQPKAFTAVNMEKLLNAGAISYINHQRGVQFTGGTLQVSSIYKWFQADFGGSEQQVIVHLLRYAQGDLVQDLQGYKGKLSFAYNWQLNE